MHNKHRIISAITEQGVLPLYFHPDPLLSIQIMKALYDAGIRVIEYTNRGASAMSNLKRLKQAAKKDCRGMLIGLGTVTDRKSAEDALEAGADFLISPGFVKEVLAVSRTHEVLWVPGCMTPSELIRARNAGIRLVKLFPGNLLGPAFVSSVRELFPDLLFMPTGGVEPTTENLKAWFQAGVSAVGMGSKLLSKTIIDNKAFAEITAKTVALLGDVKEVRQP